MTLSTIRDASTDDQVKHLKSENADLRTAVAELALGVIIYKNVWACKAEACSYPYDFAFI